MVDIYRKSIKFEDHENYDGWSDQEAEASKDGNKLIEKAIDLHDVLLDCDDQKASGVTMYVDLNELGDKCTHGYVSVLLISKMRTLSCR